MKMEPMFFNVGMRYAYYGRGRHRPLFCWERRSGRALNGRLRRVSNA